MTLLNRIMFISGQLRHIVLETVQIVKGFQPN